MPRYLLVANKTLTGPEVLASIRERAAEDAVFHIVVPDSGGPGRSSDSNVGLFLPAAGTGSAAFPANLTPGGGTRPNAGSEGARARLHEVMGLVMKTGSDVHGTIAPADPMETIREILAGGDFDEVLLSILPSGISRWLRKDLPSRVRRAFDGPVTVIDSILPATG